MPDSPWQTLSSTYPYENQWLRVRHDTVRRPDGQEGVYGVIEKGGGVYCVALNEKEEIALVHLYRYPTSTWSWEIPAGGLDGETMLTAAQRELQEETGYTAETFEVVPGVFFPMDGVVTCNDSIVIARHLTRTPHNEQAEEGIDEVRFLSFAEILTMIKDGIITDGQTIAVVMKTALHLGWITR